MFWSCSTLKLLTRISTQTQSLTTWGSFLTLPSLFSHPSHCSPKPAELTSDRSQINLTSPSLLPLSHWGSHHLLPTPLQEPPNSFLASRMGSTDLTVAPRSPQQLPHRHANATPFHVYPCFAIWPPPSLLLIVLKYTKKELFVLFPTHQAITYHDASDELCPPCLPKPSFPRLIPTPSFKIHLESLQVALPMGDLRLG